MTSDFNPPADGSPTDATGLGPYARAVGRHKLLVVAVMLATVAGTGVWLALRTPEYKATARVLVSPVSHDDDLYVGLSVPRTSPGDPTRVIQTAAELLDSAKAARLTARQFGRGWSQSRVSDQIAVDQLGQSNVLAVTATDSKPRRAKRLADTFTDVALDVRRRAVSAEIDQALARLRAKPDRISSARRLQFAVSTEGIVRTIALLERAPTPTTPVGAPAWLVVAMALLGGLTLGVAAAIVRDALDRHGTIIGLAASTTPSQPSEPVPARRGASARKSRS
jgi:uncharacterized protein involved in exopolysaccharide biosynthesis